MPDVTKAHKLRNRPQSYNRLTKEMDVAPVNV